ncbi:MAG: peptidoglycan-binding domain-containing protein [Candidatus Paceibacterota bacterium]|jgi:hypothetical protein
MKRILMTTGIAVLALATIVSAQGYTFNTNLTVGSTGADVVALQTWLMSQAYEIPAITSGAAAKGYFGSQTKAAVVAYQAANGIPNTGFVGPLTRAAINARGGVVATANCPVGMICTPINPLPVAVACPVGMICTPIGGGTPVTGGGITTAGAEGLITTKLASNPIADSNIRTISQVPVYGIEVRAQGSDMIVDRVYLQMAVGVGSATASLSNPSTFVRKLYAYDGSTLVKSWDLGAADFNKDSSDRYYVIASGMNFVVPKNATKSLTFSIDAVGVSSDQSSRYLTVQGYVGNTQNVRAIDGAGLSSYTDMSGSSNSRVQVFTTSGTSALTVTTDSGLTPKSTTNRVSTTDGVKKLVMQVFNVKSETGSSVLKTIDITVNATSTAGLPSTLYLYDSSNMLASISAPATSGGVVRFADLTVPVAQDSTKALTIKADFASTVGGQAASTSVVATGIKFEKPDSTTASSTNSALSSNDQYLYTAAPQWTLQSTSISKTTGTIDAASSTITGVIVLKATAMGGSMTKPTAGNFNFGFASTTVSSYTVNKDIVLVVGDASSTKSVSVSPSDSTVGDGGTYTVTLTGTLTSLSSMVQSGPTSLLMAVQDIDSTVGGLTIANQTWGIDTFYTDSATLQKTATI